MYFPIYLYRFHYSKQECHSMPFSPHKGSPLQNSYNQLLQAVHCIPEDRATAFQKTAPSWVTYVHTRLYLSVPFIFPDVKWPQTTLQPYLSRERSMSSECGHSLDLFSPTSFSPLLCFSIPRSSCVAPMVWHFVNPRRMRAPMVNEVPI